MKIEKDHTLLKHTLGLQPSEVAIYFYEIFDRNYIRTSKSLSEVLIFASTY